MQTVLYSKSYKNDQLDSFFHLIAKNVLNKYDIPPEKMKVLEIDRERDCSKIQDYMQQITGGRTVLQKMIRKSHSHGTK